MKCPLVKHKRFIWRKMIYNYKIDATDDVKKSSVAIHAMHYVSADKICENSFDRTRPRDRDPRSLYDVYEKREQFERD